MPNKMIKVAQIVNPLQLVISAGSVDGVRVNQKFIIYRDGDEVVDPDTKKSLGRLELVLGEGLIVHVQEKIAILESSMFTATQISYDIKGKYVQYPTKVPGQSHRYRKPFIRINVGDKAKAIRVTS